ncbi:MAG: aminofutalosine synthase MqnE [Thermoleophilia bacterium]|nr:aminofutalosine synthase MqnE [Thermoleophilia bacterium]
MCANVRLDPLAVVEEKVAQGERLSAADGLALFESHDLLRVGRLADRVRRQRVGDDVYFVVNRHINYTNVCRNHCRFCAFSRGEGEAGAYTLTVDEVLSKAREAVEQGATEIHIVGGENPSLPYSSIRAMVAGIREMAPEVHIKAFTASEMACFAEAEGVTVEEILRDLKAAGLESMPGGGAEIFRAEVRAEVCPAKISGERWLEIHKLAHGLGLKTNATMLYGHVESYADRVDHLLRLRDLQDETGGFQAFIPLAFQPKNSALSALPPTTGADDLKTIAAARLLLDNFLHIKTYWVMTGLKIAQVALFFGANDMDGTVVEEVISLLSDAGHGQVVAKSELVRVIRDAGRTPVERDALYQVVRRFEAAVEPRAGGAK